jgi:hypothetical protein
LLEPSTHCRRKGQCHRERNARSQIVLHWGAVLLFF